MLSPNASTAEKLSILPPPVWHAFLNLCLSQTFENPSRAEMQAKTALGMKFRRALPNEGSGLLTVVAESNQYVSIRRHRLVRRANDLRPWSDWFHDWFVCLGHVSSRCQI